MRKRFQDWKFRRRLLTAASVGCVLTFTSPAPAADVTWQGDVSLNWATVGNWDTDALPTLNDDAILATGQVVSLISNVGSAGNVYLGGNSTVAVSASGSLDVVNDFSVGSDPASPGTLTQSNGNLTVGKFLRIGDFAPGTYSISGGTTTIGADGGAAALLAGASVDATITVTGGQLRQADVDADNGDSLNYLGVSPGGVTTVNLSGGTISMFAATVLGQSGATTVVNQTGGVFESRDRSVRLAGAGDAENLGLTTYNMSAGTLATGSFLFVGNGDFATADLNVSGTADIQVGQAALVAVGDSASGAQGVINMTGGTLAVGVLRDPLTPRNTVGDDDLIVGAANNGLGIVHLSGTGLVDVGGAMFVGGDTFNTGNAEFDQSGGDVVVGSLADPGSPSNTFGDNDLIIGGGTGSVGRYNISGGSLTAPGFVAIGSDGSVDAELNVSGNDTIVELSGPGSAVQVGGQNATAIDDPNYGQPTAGRLTQNGGTVLVDGNLQVGSGSKTLGVYELNDGALDVVGPTFLSGVPPFEFEPGVVSTGDSEFTQTGGESVFREAVLVGYFGQGVFNLDAGTMASDVVVGGAAMIVGRTEFSAGSQVNFSGGEFTTGAAVVVGFETSKDVEMNISGDASVTVGNLVVIGSFAALEAGTYNEGTVNQTGGVVNFNGQLQIASAFPEENQPVGRAFGYYNLSGGQLNLPGTAFLGVDGTGAFRQTGGIVESGDSLVLGEAAGAEFAYELSGGTLDINRQGIFFGDGNASFEFTGGRLDGVAYLGFTLTQTGGVLATGGVPNDPAAEMLAEIDGDYFVSDAGAVEVHIAGLAPIAEHDVIYVYGVANVGGAMNVSFTDGFSPQLGDEFEVVFSEGGNVVGQFDSLSFPDLPGLDGQLAYEGQSVFLRIVQEHAGVLGDTDDDGDVDILDLNNVRNNFGAAGLGDTDGDGDVDIIDLNNVRNNFGAGPGSPAESSLIPGASLAGHRSAFRDGLGFIHSQLSRDAMQYQALLHGGLGGKQSTVVPEPGSWSLALMASLGGLLAFRRRRD